MYKSCSINRNVGIKFSGHHNGKKEKGQTTIYTKPTKTGGELGVSSSCFMCGIRRVTLSSDLDIRTDEEDFGIAPHSMIKGKNMSE